MPDLATQVEQAITTWITATDHEPGLGIIHHHDHQVTVTNLPISGQIWDMANNDPIAVMLAMQGSEPAIGRLVLGNITAPGSFLGTAFTTTVAHLDIQQWTMHTAYGCLAATVEGTLVAAYRQLCSSDEADTTTYSPDDPNRPQGTPVQALCDLTLQLHQVDKSLMC